MGAEKGDGEMDAAIEAVVSKFKKFDLNGDGVISHAELFAVLSALDAEFWSTSNVVRLMNEMDVNNDGEVDYDEFVRYTFGRSLKPEKKQTKNKRKRAPPVERVFGKIKPGRCEGADMVIAKADAATAAIRPEDVEDVVGGARGSEPEGAAVVLDTLIELLRGVDPIVRVTNRRASIRSALARKQLVINPEAFIDCLKNLRDAVWNGGVPRGNVDRACKRLGREFGKPMEVESEEVGIARKSEVPIVALLCVYVESLVEYIDLTMPMLLEEETPSEALPQISASLASPTSLSPPSRTSFYHHQEEQPSALPKIATPSINASRSSTTKPPSRQQSVSNLPSIRASRGL